jgi:hypothetical protein
MSVLRSVVDGDGKLARLIDRDAEPVDVVLGVLKAISPPGESVVTRAVVRSYWSGRG